MKDVSNVEVKTVNIHDLVIDLIGHWDKPTGDLITYHAKKPKPAVQPHIENFFKKS